MNESANGKAWGFFIASALFSLLATLMNSFVVTAFANVLFFAAIVYVAIHFAQQRRLGYFSVAVGLVAILFILGSHWFAGGVLLVIGLVAAVIDAVQNQRWLLLSIFGGGVALCGIGALLVVGGLTHEFQKAKERRIAAATATVPDVATATEPRDDGERAAASAMAVPQELEKPREPVVIPVTPAPPLTAEEAKQQQLAHEAAVRASRAEDEERRKASVLVDFATHTYHSQTCPETNNHMPRVLPAIAEMQGLQRHSCLPPLPAPPQK